MGACVRARACARARFLFFSRVRACVCVRVRAHVFAFRYMNIVRSRSVGRGRIASVYDAIRLIHLKGVNMTAAQLLRQQVELANTAHQREVADLKAAGLNPVLSANTAGAAVPNLSSFVTSSGGSAGGSGGSSARTQLKLAKANPINKMMETADHAIDAVSKLAEKQNSAKVVMQLHPERQAAADAGLNELVQNIANYTNNSNSGSHLRSWYDQAVSDFDQSYTGRLLDDVQYIANNNAGIVGRAAGNVVSAFKHLTAVAHAIGRPIRSHRYRMLFEDIQRGRSLSGRF